MQSSTNRDSVAESLTSKIDRQHVSQKSNCNNPEKDYISNIINNANLVSSLNVKKKSTSNENCIRKALHNAFLISDSRLEEVLKDSPIPHQFENMPGIEILSHDLKSDPKRLHANTSTDLKVVFKELTLTLEELFELIKTSKSSHGFLKFVDLILTFQEKVHELHRALPDCGNVNGIFKSFDLKFETLLYQSISKSLQSFVLNYLKQLHTVIKGWSQALNHVYNNVIDTKTLLVIVEKFLVAISVNSLSHLDTSDSGSLTNHRQQQHSLHRAKTETSILETLENEEPQVILTIDKKVKGAMVPTLIDMMFSPPENDKDYRGIFLFSFPLFISPGSLLLSISNRYASQFSDMNTEIGKRFSEIVDEILLLYGRSLIADPSFKMSLDIIFPKSRQESQIYKSIFDFFQKTSINDDKDPVIAWMHPLDFPIDESENTLNSLKIQACSPILLAQNITLMDGKDYKGHSVGKYLELLSATTKPSSRKNPIQATLERGERMSRKLQRVILSCLDVSDRILCLQNFIICAQTFHSQKNYHGLFTVMDALTSEPVQRLQKTWLQTSKQYQQTFETLKNVIDPNRNYMNYRLAFSNAEKENYQIIPNIKIDLMDLESIERTNSAFLDESKTIVNFDRGRKMTGILKRIARNISRHQVSQWQKKDCNPKLMMDLRTWLAACSSTNRSIPTLMDLSYQIE